MKKFTLFLILTAGSLLVSSQSAPKVDFPLGEKIKFNISYGWFSLGEASMFIGDTTISANGDQLYYNRIEAKTIGLFSWLAGLNNVYWAHVNTKNYKTVTSEKHLDERKGKFDQWNTFDYDRMQTDVKIMDYRRDNPKKEVIVNLNEDTYDLHGTYLYLRSMLGKKYEKGDSVMLNTYWVDKLYEFGMEYGGTDRIKFNGERVTTQKFYGLFPVSTTFPKERAVEVWILEKNGIGIPLIIEAELKVGRVRCELKEYKIHGEDYFNLN